MNDEENQVIDQENTASEDTVAPVVEETPKKRGRGRPRKNPEEAGATTSRRRGRPPKSATGTATGRRGRPPKTMSLVMEFERQVEARFQPKLDKAQAQINALKAELKAAKQREKAALKLFEKQQKALAKFVTQWSSKELAKVQKAGEPRKRRGRPRKNPE